MKSKNLTIGIIILIIIGIIGYFVTHSSTNTAVNEPAPAAEPAPTETEEVVEEVSPTETEVVEERGDETVIGSSIDGNDITAYHFGDGDTELLFIGGIHGGYSWATAALGYELVDYLEENPNTVPDDITVTVIPVANPDGLEEAVGTDGRFSTALAAGLSNDERVDARFNANDVDLNRNFDCEWEPEGTWQSRTVSAGDEPFSEPEAAAIRDYVNEYTPAAAVVWFSAEGKVYPSACDSVPSEESVTLAATFATAADYPAEAEFDAYAITGDMVNWMADKNIPAISVLLSTHTDTEWKENLAGIEAVIGAYAE